jgi:hypothetical protein
MTKDGYIYSSRPRYGTNSISFTTGFILQSGESRGLHNRMRKRRNRGVGFGWVRLRWLCGRFSNCTSSKFRPAVGSKTPSRRLCAVARMNPSSSGVACVILMNEHLVLRQLSSKKAGWDSRRVGHSTRQRVRPEDPDSPNRAMPGHIRQIPPRYVYGA